MGKCKRKCGISSSKDSFSNFSNSSDGNQNSQQVRSSGGNSYGSNLSGLSRSFKKSKIRSISQNSSNNGSQFSDLFAKYGCSAQTKENRQSTNQSNANLKLSATSQNSTNNGSQLSDLFAKYGSQTKENRQCTNQSNSKLKLSATSQNSTNNGSQLSDLFAKYGYSSQTKENRQSTNQSNPKLKLSTTSQNSRNNGSHLSDLFAKYGYSARTKENMQSTNQSNPNLKLPATSENSSNDSQLFKTLFGQSGYSTRTKKGSQSSNQNESNAKKKLFQHSAPKQTFSSDAFFDVSNRSESIKEHFSHLTQELIGELDVECDNVDKETSPSDDLEDNCFPPDEFGFSKHLNEHFNKGINVLNISENSGLNEPVNVNEIFKINQSPENFENTKLKLDNTQSKNNLFTSNDLNTQQDQERECSENASNFEDYLKDISLNSSEKIRTIQLEDFDSHQETCSKNSITAYNFSQPNRAEKPNNLLRSETFSTASKNTFNDASKKLRVGLNQIRQDKSLIYAGSHLTLDVHIRADDIQSQNNRFAFNYIDRQRDGDTECSKTASNFENYVKDSPSDSSKQIRKIQETSSEDTPITSYNFSQPKLAEKCNNYLSSEALSTGSKSNVNDVAKGIWVDLNHISQDKSLIYAESNPALDVTLHKDNKQSNNNIFTSNYINTQQDRDKECSENSLNFEDYLKDISFSSSEKIRKIQQEDFDFDQETSSKDAPITSYNFSQPHLAEKCNNYLSSEALSVGSKSNVNDAAKGIRVDLNQISQDKSLIYADSNPALDVTLDKDNKQSNNNIFTSNYINSQQDREKECSENSLNFEDYLKDISFTSSEKIRKIQQEDFDFDQETASKGAPITSYNFSQPHFAEKCNNYLSSEALSTGSKSHVNDAAKEIWIDLNHISQDKSLICADSKDNIQSNNNIFTSNYINTQHDSDRECSENPSNFDDYLKNISFNSSEKIGKIQLEDFDFEQETSSKDAASTSYNLSRPNLAEKSNSSLNSEALSTGSKSNFNDAAKRLRAGLNYISRDKSLIYTGSNVALDVNLGTQKKELIKSKIEDVLQWFTTRIMENQPLVFKVRTIKWSNSIFQNDVLKLKPHRESIFTEIKYAIRSSRPKFNLILYLFMKNYVLLQTDSYSTQREIYYQIKNFVDTQDQIRLAMNTISSMLNIEPWYFPIVSTSKGLVFGDLSVIISEEEIIRCNAFGGTLIPQDVTKIREFKSKAFFILVVEKDAIFKKLLDEDIPNKLTRPFIIVTGKGFPDINTRLFIKKLWMSLRIPVFILVDADPDGISIMLTYRFGSLCMSHVSEQLALPHIRWLGVFPSEIKKLKITHQTLNDFERNKIRDILKRPYVKEIPWLKRELDVLKENDVKAEIEGAIKSTTFLTDVYLPYKFYSRDYF